MSSVRSDGGKDPRDGKASSLTDPMSAPAGGSSASGAGGKGASRNAREPHAKRRWGVVLMDLILFVALVGLLAGGWFGYRALREAYAPSWESREVVLIVEMREVDPTLIPGAEDVARYSNIYDSEAADAAPLGQVTQMDVTDAEGYDAPSADDAAVEQKAPTKNVRVVIRATARYREGKGYYINASPVLAGDVGTYRMAGMAAEGTVLSLYELAEYESLTESDGATAPDSAD